MLLLLVFLLGAAVLFYPAISSLWAEKHQLGVIKEYNKTIENMDQEELDAERAKAVAYNESLLNRNAAMLDPFDEAAAKGATATEDEAYESILAMTAAMAYIEIPAIKVYLPIYHGTSDETLAQGVGHLEGSSVPVGGVGTHCVLSAHSGLPAAELFTNLEKLEKGDVFYIHVLDQLDVYQVNQIDVVLPSDTSLLAIDPAEDYVTLVTCTPYGVNSHRLLVRGTRIYPETMTDEERSALTEQESADKQLTTVEIVQYIAFFLAASLFILMTIFFVRRKKMGG
ncbi:MAG TPA: class C sortase [Clostridiales bacterium]|nr:class C sortase [Clostridiales bacterium]